MRSTFREPAVASTRAPNAGDLNGGLPDAAAAGKHEHGRRRAAAARVTSMCHAVRNVSGNAAASTKSTCVRNRNQVLGRHRDELGVAAIGM